MIRLTSGQSIDLAPAFDDAPHRHLPITLHGVAAAGRTLPRVEVRLVQPLVERALSALEDRRAALLPALRAEIATLRRQAAPRPETLLGHGPAVTRLLPKDLTWDLYARVLNAEDVP